MHDEIQNSIALVIAVAGFALGVVNYISDLTRNKEKIKLKVKLVAFEYADGLIVYAREFDESNKVEKIAIELTNDGLMKTTIDEIGFLRKGSKRRFVVKKPDLTTNHKWPVCLDPRDSVTILVPLTDFENHDDGISISHVFAVSTCDKRFLIKSNLISKAILIHQRSKE